MDYAAFPLTFIHIPCFIQHPYYLRMMKYLIACCLLCTMLIVGDRVMAQVSPAFEFRGVWVATVENIDWPSRKGLSVEQQKAEFIHLLEEHQRNGMNAIVMQVRPAADAFYPSPYEPWSEYITGKQGVAPTPFYDPLAFMIEETHKRGMEFHAWLNPYRAVFNIRTSSVSPTHITKQHPEWFINYGTTKYFNPGLPQVREFVVKVVKDIVTRYDVDGIHMDDYFYPYRITGREFPDQKAYLKYGNGLKKDDWRRSNCDSLVKQVYMAIHAIKPTVKFGISPFGVWRNKADDPDGSNTRAGTSCYGDLYANVLLWLQNGWIDYVAPQLYWEKGHRLCDYDTLLDWWAEHAYDRHLYIGHGIYRANEILHTRSFTGIAPAWRNKNELPNEIRDLREYEAVQGSVYFSSVDLLKNPNGWQDSLRRNYYALPAIVPPMPWIDSIPPAKPLIEKTKANTYSITYKGQEKIKGFAVFAIAPGLEIKAEYATLVQIIKATDKAEFIRSVSYIPADNKVFIAAIDLNNNTSQWTPVND